MKQYQSFVFESAAFDEPTHSIELRYWLDNEIEFVERLVLPANVPFNRCKDPEVLRALQALHVIGGISYYKTCLPKKIELRNQKLSEPESTFWKTVYENGLGEFFFRNNIDPTGIVNFPCHTELGEVRHKEGMVRGSSELTMTPHHDTKVLVPIGGGKDSLVTIELLKKSGFQLTLLRLGHHPYIVEMARTAGLPMITIERKLSGALFDLNAEGALNGHIPITAYLSCLTVIIALLTDHPYVAFSNERSADEGNFKHGDRDVNHQWSKSLQFENLLNEYIHTNISPNVTVFSMLRPLSELQIAHELVQYERYLPLFTSCNRNWHIRPHHKSLPQGGRNTRVTSGVGPRWCTECPKCAFSFAIFAPFLEPDEMKQIFNHSLFEDEALLPLYRELLGIEGHKPFECVGTAREVAAAFLLAHKTKQYDDTAAMKMFIAEALPHIKDPKEVIEESISSASLESLPAPFKPLIENL